MPKSFDLQRCPRCHSELKTIVLHADERCLKCRSNIFKTCSGDNCDTDYNLGIGYKRS
jgi:hypothetical protein